MTTEPAKLGIALRYLSLGWSILPLRGRDKRPLIAWEHLQRIRPSTATVAEWFRRWPEANLGIVTGEVSGLVVLDVDPAHGGEASLEDLERHGRLPVTVESITGGGGRHLYFSHPGDLVPNRAGLAPGIDLRGDGGYVVAPPSIHPNGRRYAWAPGRSPEELAPAAPPNWIFDGRGELARRTLPDWRRLVREGVPEGERNSTIASLTGHLLRRDVDPEVALELMLAWNRLRCHPPLDDTEVAAVVSNIVRRHREEEAS